MTADQVIDGSVVEEHGHELVPAPQPSTLFRTDDPVEVVARASKVAEALKSVLDKQGLTQNIQGKSHVRVEGWTTLGAMVGVTAVPVWTKPLDGDAPQGRQFGYEARVEARTLDGRVIGAAEAMCTRSENRWKGADDYAIRSMAQTRATSKALRGPLGFVVTLAGYDATPAEEMPRDAQAAPGAAPAAAPGDRRITRARAKAIVDAAFAVGVQDKLQLAASHALGDDVGDCSTKAKAVSALATLTTAQADRVEHWIQRKAGEQTAATGAPDDA